jgi:hypothetical protein
MTPIRKKGESNNLIPFKEGYDVKFSGASINDFMHIVKGEILNE